MVKDKRFVPITVTREGFVPRSRGRVEICPKCNTFHWEEAYAPSLYSLTKGKSIWRCGTCKETRLELTKTNLLKDAKPSSFGEIDSFSTMVLNLVELLPCPVCLGTNLSPIYDRTSPLYLKCDLCDHEVIGSDLYQLVDLYNRCYRHTQSVEGPLEAWEIEYLVQVLYLYLLKYNTYAPNPSFIAKVYPKIPRYMAGKISRIAATILKR